MIKIAAQSDNGILAELAMQLWDGHSLKQLQEEFEQLTANPDAACFIKYADGQPVGFAQCQLRRDYVEGTRTSPVGYLEGIFVMEGFRGRGYARNLLSCCENWAKQKECAEFASDCEFDNEFSLHFHLAMGFEVANRIICFKKALGEQPINSL